MHNFLCAESPRLVVCFVVDQLSHHNLMRISPFMHGGIKKLLDNGIVYDNASWPSALAATGPDHTGLTTGALGSVHGIINNDWFDQYGNEIACDSDSAQQAAVFSANGLYDYGKSARNIMVDTVGDQAMLASSVNTPFEVISITLKSRSAIPMAGRLGKPFWFDKKCGRFTTSKAYFNEFPEWMSKYNKSVASISNYRWTLLFEKTNRAYAVVNPSTYSYARTESLLNKELDLTTTTTKAFFSNLIETPKGHEFVLDAARAALEHYWHENAQATILLFVGLSAVDKMGHLFGPDSYEYNDSLYQLDRYLEEFMNWVEQKISPSDTLYLFTSDHGSMPIAELLQKKRFSLARRIVTTTLIERMNNHLCKKLGIVNLVHAIDTPHIYFNHKLWSAFDAKLQQKITILLKRFLTKQPGIKTVWTYNELMHGCFTKDDEAFVYKNQIFPNRSGHLIFHVFPYVYVSKYHNGTGHKTPYAYDTHVPLVVYQSTQLEHKKIMQPVSVQQVACTLTELLQIAQPSAATFPMLPHIFEEPTHD
jgi:predicted AlkP superfamily pyrophosphatase or phosphodiesterase